ncbi:hypothetical protein ACFQU2_37695 [Siccirubricoccus deserti]
MLEVGEAPGLPSSVAGALAQGWKPAGPLPPAPADLPEAALLSWLADAIAGLCAEAPPMADVVALLRDNLGAIRRLRAELRNHDPNPAGRNLPVTLLRAARAPVAGLGGAPWTRPLWPPFAWTGRPTMAGPAGWPSRRSC